jgi:homogentisate 1,2-dioxygenase
MIESSRLFLFTEYARKGCGTIETHGTDYKVWEALPVRSQAFRFQSVILMIH